MAGEGISAAGRAPATPRPDGEALRERAGPAPSAATLRPGARLQARVAAVLDGAQALLDIGGARIEVRSTLALQVGQGLHLEVTHAGGLVVLARRDGPAAGVTAEAAAAPAAAARRGALDATRRLLPLQRSLAPLLATARTAAAAPATGTSAVASAPLAMAAREFLNGLATVDELTDPERLALRLSREMGGSGPAGGGGTPAAGTRAGLLRLLQALAAAADTGGDAPPPRPTSYSGAAGAPALVAGTARPPAPADAPPLPTPAGAAARIPRPGEARAVLDTAAGRPVPAGGAGVAAGGGRTVAASEVPPPLPGSEPQAQGRVPAAAAEDAAALRDLLARQAAGALARQELLQLARVPAPGDERMPWLLELPVRAADGAADVLALRIDRDGHGEGLAAAAAHPWRVTLAFALPGLGELRATVGLGAGGERVSTWFRAAEADAADRIEAALPALRERLRAQGLEVGELFAGRGGGAEAGGGAHRPAGAPALLDERA